MQQKYKKKSSFFTKKNGTCVGYVRKDIQYVVLTHACHHIPKGIDA